MEGWVGTLSLLRSFKLNLVRSVCSVLLFFAVVVLPANFPVHVRSPVFIPFRFGVKNNFKRRSSKQRWHMQNEINKFPSVR